MLLFIIILVVCALLSVGVSYLVWGGSSQVNDEISHGVQELKDKHRMASLKNPRF